MPEDLVGSQDTIFLPKNQHQIDRLKRMARDCEKQLGGYEEESLSLLFTPLVYFKTKLIEALIENGKVEKDLIIDQIQKQFPEEFECGSCFFPRAWSEVSRLCEESVEDQKI